MGSFNVNFLDLPTDSTPVAETYESFFLHYDPLDWRRGSGGGSFCYIDDDGTQSSLVICEHPQRGISLMYNSARVEWLSVGDPTTINEFIIVPDDLVLPRGSFVAPQIAWGAVKSFIETPQELPNSVRWIVSNELKWPLP